MYWVKYIRNDERNSQTYLCLLLQIFNDRFGLIFLYFSTYILLQFPTDAEIEI